MRESILFITDIVNAIHDLLIDLFQSLGFQLTDKELHFWIIGLIGIVTFIFVYITFKMLSKWKFSIATISFIYTFTMMIILVFAIEIQQGITNRGHMDFSDAVIGLWGFVVFFFIYAVIGLLFLLIKRGLSSKTKKKNSATPSHNRRSRHL
ncbi:hypothetical protein [Metabacillus iocasae]|uniref:Membrane protein n=1 Tax=Priestia iocasae TaxID=2291674 RepID=A0ABS2QTE8_9BACI|nr:hypothetical protein [Metabacillus iocasae]MBM7702031.1 putative membrane protein [Metabacillus iocasae]